MKKRLWSLMTAAMLIMLLAAPASAREEGKYHFIVGDDDLAVAQGLDPAWENILLLGTDSRQDETEGSRSDAIMVCSVNKQSGAIRLTSLARDMWLRFPDTQMSNKLNTAYRFGGPNLAMKTVNDLLGLNITKYAVVNFYSFCDIIDAMGGIELTLTSAEINVINRSTEAYGGDMGETISPDAQTAVLSGAQALAYARIRKLDNDFGRTQRQRHVIAAVLRKAMQMRFAEQIALIRRCFDCVKTNLSLSDAVQLGSVVLTCGTDDMQELSLPMKGQFRYDSADGTSKLVVQPEKMRAQIQAFIYGETGDLPAQMPEEP